MIWYDYWASEVKRFRENRTPCPDLCVNEKPIFKNKSTSYPWTNILHVWLKICRNYSILWIRVIKIKKSRNRNVKYKSLQNSVLIYRTRSRFLQKRSPRQYWSEAWMKDGIWRSYLFLSFLIFTEVFPSRSAS